MFLSAGSVIVGRYRLDRMLGEGGMGEVWAATHLVTQKPVALKFLKPSAAKSPGAIRRFLREARAASAVRHPNVVEIHDVVELPGGMPAMVMDLLAGESFASRLARERTLPLVDLSRVMVPVLSALGTAHSLGIVHRDLKPDNIFLERGHDGTMHPRVLDFGIAKLSATEGAAAQTADLTNTGSVMGTPYYMAPEQVFGEKDVDQRVDVWAIGVILYEALAGARPIDGDNFGQILKAITTGAIRPLEQVAPHLPEDVRSLVRRMLSVNRAERPADLREPFDILSKYTDEKAASFASARTPVPEQPSTDPGAAFAPTEQSDAKVQSDAAFAPTDASLSRSQTIPGLSKPNPRVLVLVGVLAALGLGGLLLRAVTQDKSAAPAGPAAPELTAAPTPPPVPVPLPTPSLPPPLTQPESQPGPLASSTPVPSASALKGGKIGKHVDPTPKASATVTTAGATPSPPASHATATKLPGGVASSAPF